MEAEIMLYLAYVSFSISFLFLIKETKRVLKEIKENTDDLWDGPILGIYGILSTILFVAGIAIIDHLHTHPL